MYIAIIKKEKAEKFGYLLSCGCIDHLIMKTISKKTETHFHLNIKDRDLEWVKTIEEQLK
jgi:hypothetical protein